MRLAVRTPASSVRRAGYVVFISAAFAFAVAVDWLLTPRNVVAAVYGIALLLAAWLLDQDSVVVMCVVALALSVGIDVLQADPLSATLADNAGLLSISILVVLLVRQRRLIRAARTTAVAARQRLELQFQAAHALAEATTVAEASTMILAAIGQHLGWTCGALWSVEPPAHKLRCVATWHRSAMNPGVFDALTRSERFAPGVALLSGRVFEDRQPVWISDVHHEPRTQGQVDSRQTDLHGAIGFPILDGSAVLAVAGFFSSQVEQRDQEVLTLMASVGAQMGLFLSRRRSNDELAERLVSEQAARAEVEHAVIEHERLYKGEQRARGEAESLAAERDAILRQIADGVVIANPSGAVIFANDVAKRLLGLPDPALPLTLRTGRYPVLTRDGQPYLPEDLPLARAAQRGDVVVDFELRIRHPDGTERVAQESAVPVAAEDGTRRGAVLTVHDVTAQRELERHKEEFFANASHDLRTPVATIKASIDVVLDNEPPGMPQEVHRLLLNINREADRMTTLVNDLLELTRLQTGKGKLDFTAQDLRIVAERVARAIEPLARVRGQRVELVLPKRAIVAQADAHSLERALLNLLANAQRYGREGGVIRLRLRRRTTEAVFSVEDDGPGISETDQALIFDRFYRSANETTRRDQGSGLGLPIARAMAELHGGRLWVESIRGRGATFRIALPVAEPALPGRSPRRP